MLLIFQHCLENIVVNVISKPPENKAQNKYKDSSYYRRHY